MSEPFTLTVLKALTNSLEQISVANGYNHDLTGSVFRGRIRFSDGQDPLPMVSIMQPPGLPEDMQSPKGSSARKIELKLLIQGFVDDDIRNPTDPAYMLMHDVERRLFFERTRDEGFNVLGFNGQVQLDIGQGIVRPPDGVVSDTAFFWLPIILELASVPYTV